jgi:hypothetical protein
MFDASIWMVSCGCCDGLVLGCIGHMGPFICMVTDAFIYMCYNKDTTRPRLK